MSKDYLFQVNSYCIFSGGACPFITELFKDFIKSIANCLPTSSFVQGAVELDFFLGTKISPQTYIEKHWKSITNILCIEINDSDIKTND